MEASNVNGRVSWTDLVAQKRQQCDEIPAEWQLSGNLLDLAANNPHLLEADVPRRSGIMSNAELDVTENYSASQLLRELSTGKLDSVTVTTAFCKRAAIAQQVTSCLTETFFPQALERARFLDECLQGEGRVVGPLHGLPVSIKDSFCVKGVQSTIGFVSFLEHPPSSSNSALVDMLLGLGAVLYVKTNVPQTMMTGDSENNIFGRTLNPHNTNLTAGGSSGGEGALVAFRGSVLGAGTDIAGSVRIPSLCCGVYGFKPTTDRIPFGGQVSGAMEGLPGLKPSAGLLATSLDDVELFMSTVIDGDPWRYDVTAVATPWQRVDLGPSPLTIGVLSEDPHYPLHPSIRRCLQNAVKALAGKGHHIVPLHVAPEQSVSYSNRVAFQYLTYGPHVDHVAASGEPLVSSVAKFASPMFTGPFPVNPDLDVFSTIEQLHRAKHRLCELWRQTWLQDKLDVILAPAAQCTAVPHDTFGWPPYTMLWNVLDYPACVIPYGKASKELDPDPMTVDDGVQPNYDPLHVDGAPCSIQVVTPRYQDEKCLSAARVVEAAIR